MKSTKDFPAERLQAVFLTGETIPFASTTDQRFSYSLYVPPRAYRNDSQLRLVVLIHGTGRDTESLRQRYADFAEDFGFALFIPFFPAGITDPDDIDNYKGIAYNGIRYDHVLLGMLQEVAHRWPGIEVGKFLLHGFSGGGQFVQRFLYLHPHKLIAVSIGAPGSITLLDDNVQWSRGIRNFEAIFGTPISIDDIRRVPIHICVGKEDTDVTQLRLKYPDALSRLTTAQNLSESYKLLGLDVKLDIVPESKHESQKMKQVVVKFLSSFALEPDLTNSSV